MQAQDKENIKNILRNLIPQESPNRFFMIGIGFIILMLLVLFKILHFQFVEGERWRTQQAQFNRPQFSLIPPKRGNIYSNDGHLLSATITKYRLSIDARHDYFEKIGKNKTLLILKQIAQLYQEYVPELKANELYKRWKYRYELANRVIGEKNGKKIYAAPRNILLSACQINYADWESMQGRIPFYEKNEKGHLVRTPLHRVFKTTLYEQRTLPFESLAARTIGNTYPIRDEKKLSHGRSGVENTYDKYLVGACGFKKVLRSGGRLLEKELKKAKAGDNIYLTIDMQQQYMVEKALRDELEKVKAAQSGTAILMDVKTGAIRAISNLSQDKNGFWHESENYALKDLNEPGSVIKTASLMIAMDEGFCKENQIIDVGDGTWKVGGANVKDWSIHTVGGFGAISVAEGLAYSSNVVIAKIIQNAYGKDPSRFVRRLKRLGFRDLGIEMSGVATPILRMPENKKYWDGTTLAWMSFGYNTQIPPIYVLAFYNAIANGGKLMRPYFISRITDEAGNVLREGKPVVVNSSICKSSTLKSIRHMLHMVVNYSNPITHRRGTGVGNVRSSIVAIAGKSGTAQRTEYGGGYAKGLKYTASFAGYFPEDKPQYSLIVVIKADSPIGGGHEAGSVFKNIAENVYGIDKYRSLDSIKREDKNNFYPHIVSCRELDLKNVFQRYHIPFVEKSYSDKTTYVVPTYEKNKNIYELSPVTITTAQMPNLVGMGLSDAIYYLHTLGVRVLCKGYGCIVRQSILSGTPIQKGQSCILYLKPTCVIEEELEQNPTKKTSENTSLVIPILKDEKKIGAKKSELESSSKVIASESQKQSQKKEDNKQEILNVKTKKTNILQNSEENRALKKETKLKNIPKSIKKSLKVKR